MNPRLIMHFWILIQIDSRLKRFQNFDSNQLTAQSTFQNLDSNHSWYNEAINSQFRVTLLSWLTFLGPSTQALNSYDIFWLSTQMPSPENWFESAHDISSISETWIDSTHDSSGFQGIDWESTQDSSAFPGTDSDQLKTEAKIFDFISTHDSTLSHTHVCLTLFFSDTKILD